MDISSWQSQLRKGAAELVVLSSLRTGKRYGLEILERVNRSGGIVTEGALYPLLNRLEKEGKVMSNWVLGDSLHPRKYYGLTDDGALLVTAMTAAWIVFRISMTDIVESQQ